MTTRSDSRTSNGPCEASSAVELASGRRSLRRACQRGMATAEYAVGILAAVALALVLLSIFTNNDFFQAMLKFVLNLLTQVGGMLP